MFALQVKDSKLAMPMTQSKIVETFGLQPAGTVVTMPACKCQKIARINTGSTAAIGHAQTSLTQDLPFHCKQLNSKYLDVAKWKLQGRYFLTHIVMWKDLLAYTAVKLSNRRDWMLACFHHDACGVPFLFDCWEEVLAFWSTCPVDDVFECRWWFEVLFGFHWQWCIVCRFNQVTLEICSWSPL